MKAYWLKQGKSPNLIVFFVGWSFDFWPFVNFDSNKYDVLIVYDYSNLEIPKEFEQIKIYSQKTLIAWSMGVFVANKLKNLFTDFKEKIAINGTINPVDDNLGIPEKIFELTLKHASLGLREKFYKNVFKTDNEFMLYSQNPVQRSIQNRVDELEFLYSLIKNESSNKDSFFDVALVSEFDKIIPPQNQCNSHANSSTPVIKLQSGHFPFYDLGGWEGIIKKCRPILK